MGRHMFLVTSRQAIGSLALVTENLHWLAVTWTGDEDQHALLLRLIMVVGILLMIMDGDWEQAPPQFQV